MRIHGRVDSYWQDNVLVLHAYGPFNEEGIDQAIEQPKTLVNNRPVQAWNRLEIRDDETMGSPEVAAKAKAKALDAWFESNGCRHIAVVVRNNMQIYVVQELLQSHAKVFHDLNEAKKWLAEKA
ncbi:hypothetical protein SG34_003195 [Thalassomonas viridans]|uniref:Uncharacterized protein n=1 Tax=Thalassomonas viridans TaxID=137584 RepID=A0AAE9Z3I0_9GAMM|nr:hypothetical protein [Thalassomonas viridans]WDE05950.1 hypothetical protein SG34_003195 [Thalassomonas viridans]